MKIHNMSELMQESADSNGSKPAQTTPSVSKMGIDNFRDVSSRPG